MSRIKHIIERRVGIGNMNIIEAYKYLEKGYLIKRKSWKEWSRLATKNDTFILDSSAEGFLISPDSNGTITLIVNKDVLANDWEIKEG